jgi:ribonucleoside-diphosphate reductase alpha chain
MGLGATGIANAIEIMIGEPSFGNEAYCAMFEKLSKVLCYESYRASIRLAKERGAFPLFERDKYLAGEFIKTLPDDIQQGIHDYGIRNSHLVSYAPCGTISQIAGNVSSGVEPIFFHEVKRDVHMSDGIINIALKDFNWRHYGFKGKTLEDCTVEDHITTAGIAQKYCDSAVSKTVNVAPSCTYSDYENIYLNAYKSGAKGMTVFRPTEMRGAVITKAEPGQSGSCKDGVCIL